MRRFGADLVAALSVALAIAGCAIEAREDPLPRELRHRVEALERSVAAAPTDSSNYRERVTTLWEWANALALEGDPDALGMLRFTSNEPLVAASWVTLEQVWTVGSRPLRPGGKIAVAKQLATDQGRFQATDARADHSRRPIRSAGSIAQCDG